MQTTPTTKMSPTNMSEGDDDTIVAINGIETKKIKNEQRKFLVNTFLCRNNELIRELTCWNNNQLSTTEIAAVDSEPKEANARLQRVESALKATGRRFPARLHSGVHRGKRQGQSQLDCQGKSSIQNGSEGYDKEEEDRPPRIIFLLPIVYDRCIYDVDGEGTAPILAQE
jgi:hypothetical protein